jgi:thiol-disulfide isomerase/thioredoxin
LIITIAIPVAIFYISIMEAIKNPYRAPEIYGDYWLNSDPLPISVLRGNVVLVDFWDATCPVCFRGIPYVQEWLRRYSELGLVVIGVHSPKFPFEKNPAFVETVVRQLEIQYPVVMDNDMLMQNLFRTRLLPSRCLIDKNGFFRYIHEGEGSYHAFESSIQSLIAEIGYRGEFPTLMEPIREEDRPGVHLYRATPEIFVGYQKGTIGNTEGYFPQAVHTYHDPHIYLEGRIYLEGEFLVNKHFVKFEGDESEEGKIILRYMAKEVYVVIDAVGKTNYEVFVTQDGKDITPEIAGKDIKFDNLGRSYLVIGGPQLYSVVKNSEHSEHVLNLFSRSNGFAFYAASFTSAPITESISRN